MPITPGFFEEEEELDPYVAFILPLVFFYSSVATVVE